jgi:hypothetical protein
MIISKTVEIVVNSRQINYFSNLGYSAIKGDIISIPIKHLNHGSHVKIEVSCDICNKIKFLSFKDYNKNIKKHNIYGCSNKCSMNKFKLTCVEKYGVDNVSQLSDVKNKIQNNLQEKYGVSNVMLVPEFNFKMKESQRIAILNNGNEIVSKRKATMLDRHNVENASQGEEFRIKAKETTFKNYGVDNPSKSDIVKQKKIETTLKNYGVDNPLQNKEIFEKSKQTKIKNGNQIPDELLTDWQKYKKEVTIITNKNKKLLFEIWDGLDYYDYEYIKDNLFKFKYYEKNFPTIDHKISLFYGFLNKIDSEFIGNIKNLCITKKCINSSKREMTEDAFLTKN